MKNPAKVGVHLGPLPSRKMAALVVDGLQSALPLRRCTQRLGRNHQPETGAPVCSAAQLGVAHCPCSGTADAREYAACVEQAKRAMYGDPSFIIDVLRARMTELASQQRFEEAAMTRDRLSAVLGAIRRTSLLRALSEIGDAEVTLDGTTWIIAHGRLLDVRASGQLTAALPVEPLGQIEPGRPTPRDHADEALCLAKFFDKHAAHLAVSCSGAWTFPVHATTEIPPLPRAA